MIYNAITVCSIRRTGGAARCTRVKALLGSLYEPITINRATARRLGLLPKVRAHVDRDRVLVHIEAPGCPTSVEKVSVDDAFVAVRGGPGTGADTGHGVLSSARVVMDFSTAPGSFHCRGNRSRKAARR